MATLRKGYTANCHYFRDSDTVLPIRWYRCLPNAPELGTESAISPLGWMKFPWTHKGVGEIFNGPWKYTPGIPIPAATGETVCGSERDFNDGAHYDPELPPTIYRPDQLPICCAPLPGGIVMGGSSPASNPSGGIELAGPAYVIHRPLVPSDGALVISGSWPPWRYCDHYTVMGFPRLFVVSQVTPGGDTYTGGVWTMVYTLTAPPLASWVLSNSLTGQVYTNPLWDGSGSAVFDLSAGSGPLHCTVVSGCP